ncbi:DUF6286 domain-containing protein [Corynebacterium tapiri]|uniref:DUF6286 domain-containing protein n=1 Tax=Corynebacterium tapiri TaxID=1448266 RepID=A0A5C4U5T7_9CORY|nr:DUF6286 domain-containing protein [Corynebacterium tapiri]TNL98577.1 hypothetical protein FHE74_05085 [Corynebacterium tapiri]
MTKQKGSSSRGFGLKPASSPQVRWWTILLSLLLIAAGLVAARELLVMYRPPQGWTSWLEPIPQALQSMTKELIAISGAIALLIGLILLVAALAPRKKRYREVSQATPSVWMRPVDIARFTTARAKQVPGVINATSLAKKNRVTVEATALNPDSATQQRIEERLKSELASAFGSDVNVRVKLSQAQSQTASSDNNKEVSA